MWQISADQFPVHAQRSWWQIQIFLEAYEDQRVKRSKILRGEQSQW